VVIREQVTLDPGGNGYHGAFTVDSVDLNGNAVFHLTGRLLAQRITVN